MENQNTEKERVMNLLWSKAEEAGEEGYHETCFVMSAIAESLENDEITIRGVIKSLIDQYPQI